MSVLPIHVTMVACVLMTSMVTRAHVQWATQEPTVKQVSKIQDKLDEALRERRPPWQKPTKASGSLPALQSGHATTILVFFLCQSLIKEDPHCDHS